MSERPEFVFGPFRLDAAARRLHRGDELLPMSSRAFDILTVLVRRAGQTVSKSELMETVWPGVFVEEANIAQHISQLRKLLGDTTKQPTYIATLPREGYRFLAPVTLAGEAQQALSVPVEPAENPGVTGSPFRVRRPVAVSVAAFLALVSLLGFQVWIPARQPTASSNPEAQRAYERGRFLQAQNTPNSSVLAREEFERAVQLDPGFVDAQADLALAYVSLSLARRIPRAEALARASAAAATALALDPNSSEAHTAQGAIDLQFRDDSRAAARELARATFLDSSNVMALDLLARALRQQGWFDESARVARRALALDPTSVRAYMNLTQTILFSGRNLDEGIDLCRQALVLSPNSAQLLEQAADIAEAAGRLDESVAFRVGAERAQHRDGFADVLESTHRERGYATAMIGYLEARLAALDPADPAVGFERGRLLARLGRVDDAFAALDAAIAGDFSIGVFALRYHPAYRALRADPRFAGLEARANPK